MRTRLRGTQNECIDILRRGYLGRRASFSVDAFVTENPTRIDLNEDPAA